MLISRLELKKVLSFRESTIELGPLNVLIGPNAVGKSNLIEVIDLLRAVPNAFTTTFLQSGGVREWLWLGERPESRVAEVKSELRLRRGRQTGPVRYVLQFSEDSNSNVPVILRERIERINPPPGWDGMYLNRESNQAVYGGEALRSPQFNQPMLLSAAESVLAQLKNPNDPTPITELGKHFSEIQVFREFRTGRQSGARQGTPTTTQRGALQDGGDNLALVLNDLIFRDIHERIKVYLQRFCDRFVDIKIDVGQGIARAFLREAGLTELLSAVRMSDGTLKFLSLLAALFHPQPPPLMCIEEPEVGLHPDALQLVADALLEASQKTQLIVTTHSADLVDALSDQPETVLVCERDFDNGTQMKRLSKEGLKQWLERYTLGELWRRGEIGGGRW